MPDKIVKILLDWYDKNQRSLPWRTSEKFPNPYFVWLSEIMLQQTTVPTVIPYFQRFLKKWPSIDYLANASRDDILHAWQGLGYYTRAHKLHECALLIHQKYNNNFPRTYEELLNLPGVGPYTAAAIASIAFNKPVPVVDGNVERLISRLYAIECPKKDLKKYCTEVLNTFPLIYRPGDIAQSMMDFANSLCTSSRPKCSICPLSKFCKAYQMDITDKLPKKEIKKKPIRYAQFLIIKKESNETILIYKRPTTGLLPGLWSFPSTPWQPDAWPDVKMFYSSFIRNSNEIEWIDTIIRHTFTHFHLDIKVGQHILKESFIKTPPFPEICWTHPQELNEYALPTLMKKIARSANIIP